MSECFVLIAFAHIYSWCCLAVTGGMMMLTKEDSLVKVVPRQPF